MNTPYVIRIFLIASLGPTFVGAQSLVVDVESYGAVANSNTDNTSAISKAMAALHQGDTLYFPCTAGAGYNVKSPINFGGLSQVKIQGAGKQCGLLYVGSGSQPYAFSFVGASNIEVGDLTFMVQSSSSAPKAILLLGRAPSDGFSGLLQFNEVQVQGYATEATVYSIASEQNTWMEPRIILQGGGALYGFYTSSTDDLGVDGLPSGSNLSSWMQNFDIVDESSGITPSHTLILDAGDSSGAGNHTYRDGYLSSIGGTGIGIYANSGYTNYMALTIDSIRFENGYQMFNFTGGGKFGDIALTNNKGAGVTKYMINLPTGCYDCTFQNNTIDQGSAATSVFGFLNNSYVSEGYAFTVGSTSNSYIENRQSGLFQIGSPYGSTASCSASNEGALQYVKGSGSSNGVFRICEYYSRGYNWVNH